MNISWNTTKTAAGYNFRVYLIVGRTEAEGPFDDGLYGRITTLKTGTCATRAQAKGLAQRWGRYLKANPAKIAA
jgi:hypothetical protein